MPDRRQYRFRMYRSWYHDSARNARAEIEAEIEQLNGPPISIDTTMALVSGPPQHSPGSAPWTFMLFAGVAVGDDDVQTEDLEGEDDDDGNPYAAERRHAWRLLSDVCVDYDIGEAPEGY